MKIKVESVSLPQINSILKLPRVVVASYYPNNFLFSVVGIFLKLNAGLKERYTKASAVQS